MRVIRRYVYGASRWKARSGLQWGFLGFLVVLFGCSYEAGAPYGLTVLDVDTGERRVFPVDGRILAANDATGTVYVWDRGNLYVVALDGPSHAPTRVRPSDGERSWSSAAFSPSFTLVAWFDNEVPGAPSERYSLHVVDLAGKKPPQRIFPQGTASQRYSRCLEWISEEALVCVFGSGSDYAGKFDNCIARVSAVDGCATVLFRGTDYFDDTCFALSPNREQLAFYEPISGSDSCRVRAVNVQSGEVTTLVESRQGWAHGYMAWSPDGTQLAYDAADGLWLLNLKDASTKRISPRAYYYDLLFLAPDCLVANRYREGPGVRCYVFDPQRAQLLKTIKANTFHTVFALPKRHALVHDTGSHVPTVGF